MTDGRHRDRGGCSGRGSCCGCSGGGSSRCTKHASIVGQRWLEICPVEFHQGSSCDRDHGGVDVLDMGGREVSKQSWDAVKGNNITMERNNEEVGYVEKVHYKL